ncbi:GNAT family N-acetyltransferase [Brachybacterium ginsengisoli]|uniref:GNAT family N-acetyltransferase n=1 Tax=Brachybacterium ginsengisoli TaxID=1331682 RepID=A0A291GVK2_9MICO|nr:GNAT family N-acetyltransferase [Brachybacterium ginsengisoli]ATG54217.1 GNAT family N-acetyltransferase [Brachybacterium ginsengisoli]
MHEVIISRGIGDSERSRVAELYWEAFARKLRPGFRDDQTGVQAVKAGLQSENVLVARRQGALLGVCGFYGAKSGAVDLKWSSLRRALTISAAARASTVLAVLSRSTCSDALVLDGICVDRAARGLGIGTALLNAASSYARSIDVRRVRLSVVDSNPRARALYERQGFRPVGGGALGFLSVVYGFDGYTTMELKVV